MFSEDYIVLIVITVILVPKNEDFISGSEVD
jgi:hypothetical protein